MECIDRVSVVRQKVLVSQMDLLLEPPESCLCAVEMGLVRVAMGRLLAMCLELGLLVVCSMGECKLENSGNHSPTAGKLHFLTVRMEGLLVVSVTGWREEKNTSKCTLILLFAVAVVPQFETVEVGKLRAMSSL